MKKGLSKPAIVAILFCSFAAQLYQLLSMVLAYVYAAFPAVNTNIVIMVITLPSLLSIFCNYPLGPLCKRYDRKMIMLTGFLLYIIEAVLILTIGKNSFSITLFVTCLGGVAFAICGTVTDIVFGEYDPSGFLLSMNRVVTNGALLLVMGIAGRLASDGSWYKVFYVYAILIPMTIYYLLVTPRMKGASMAEFRSDDFVEVPGQENIGAGGVQLLAGLTAGAFLFQTAIMILALNYSTYIITEFQLGTSIQTGYCGTVMSFGGMLGGLLSFVLYRKFKNRTSVIFSLLFGCGLFLIAVHPSLPSMYVGGFLQGFCGLPVLAVVIQMACNNTIK
ncbi:MAG: MFS transporter, partial [Clostridiales bacterium]|nr:MFS transporter [Clostridiales bacterium]